MKKACGTFLILYLCAIAGLTNGQPVNINTSDGLLTQHTYCLLTDRNGYLWAGTSEGVYRYNGYSLKKFDNTNGLPYKDIWSLYEDSSGRIWLFSISDQLGYISNEQFHLARRKSDETLYPNHPIANKGRLVFLSSYNSGKSQAVYTVMRDTVFSSSLPGDFKNVILTPRYMYTISSSGSIARLAYTINGNGNLFMKEAYRYLIKGIDSLLGTGYMEIFSRYWIHYLPGAAIFHILDLPAGKMIAVNSAENIHLVSVYRDHLYVTGDHNIYVFDTLLRNISVLPISSITNNRVITGKDIAHFIDDPLWGKCIATRRNGIYIGAGPAWPLQVTDSSSRHLRYLGCSYDGTNYWWDNIRRKVVVADSAATSPVALSQLTNATFLAPYNHDSSIIANIGNTCWLDHRNGTVQKVLDKGGFKGIILNDTIYTVSQTSGFYSFDIKDPAGSFKELDSDRFSGMEYDGFTRSFWLYSGHKIVIFRNNTKVAVISSHTLNSLGINNIEGICFDRFGNIYLNADGHLAMFHPASFTVRELAWDFVPYGAVMAAKADKLIVAGRFGWMYLQAGGPAIIGKRKVNYNRKGATYNNIDAVALSQNHPVIKTDNGYYELPADVGQVVAVAPYVRLVTFMDGAPREIRPGDTLKLAREASQVTFDLVNPMGAGKAEYGYRILENGAVFSKLADNGLPTRGLEPDCYYHLEIMPLDEIWKGQPVPVSLYIIPDWWQKRSGRLLLFCLALMTLLVIITTSVLFTRQMVYNIQRQKNLFLELKLKAIYAQLNPHFIFNTLGIIQFFTGRNDSVNAANVVERFSRVLRSYLWASRNKLISLKQEIEHLENYIGLQQLRFVGKFDYRFSIDNDLDIANVQVPSLLFQPLIENAINHGLFHRKKDGILHIQFKATPDKKGLVCIIDDNGVGRRQAKEIEKNNLSQKESYGSELINDLVAFFKKYEALQIKIEYIDKIEPDSGTIVIITMRDAALKT